jgi:hypothetical protein
MNRFRIVLGGVLIGVAFPGPARGDEDDDERLVRRLVTAAERHAELREAAARYDRPC